MSFTCNECDAQFRDPSDNASGDLTCPRCATTDITKVRVPSQDEIDGRSDAQHEAFVRVNAERKAYWDRMYAGMDFASIGADLARASCDTGTLPIIRMGMRQAS